LVDSFEFNGDTKHFFVVAVFELTFMCSYELYPWIHNDVTVTQQHSKGGARSVVDNSVLRDTNVLQIRALPVYISH
jgi:hypothetical protein